MLKQKVLITAQGLKNLQKEYEKLIKVERPSVIAELTRTRELGDLKENGAYHAARERQSFLEGRIREIESIFKNFEIVSDARNGTVNIGSKVTLKTPSNNKIVYTIVGDGETDFAHKKIAHNSPLGNAITGKKKGDTVIVKTPLGDMQYAIVSVE